MRKGGKNGKGRGKREICVPTVKMLFKMLPFLLDQEGAQ